MVDCCLKSVNFSCIFDVAVIYHVMEGNVKAPSLNQQSDAYDFHIKLLMVGDNSAGKSTLLLRFTDDTYTQSYISTIGVDFRIRTMEIDGKLIRVQIWDTAGQERFKTITNSYYRGAHGVMFVYDVADAHSYSSIDNWVQQCERYASPDVIRMLIGNNCDKVAERQVEFRQAAEYAASNNMKLMECSPKLALNVDEAFSTLVRDVIERQNYLSVVSGHGNRMS